MSARSYKILGLLGAGGFGKVYRATFQGPHGFQKEVAIKRLLAMHDSDANRDFERRLRDEARILSMLKHRNIVVVDLLTRLDGDWCVVMELLPGADLLAVLTRAGPLPERAALEATAETAAALAYAWDAPGPDGRPLRIMHRDIKPSNLVLCEDGALKVLDFGIARAEYAGREAKTRDIAFGTANYMPPERRAGVDSDTEDAYSVAAVLFNLLDGDVVGDAQIDRAAHEAVIRAGLARLNQKAPLRAELLELLRAGLSRAPTARPTVAEIAARCRTLARDAEGEDLLTFAARVVPTLRADRARRATDRDPEIGRVLIEQAQDTIPVSGPISGPVDPFPSGATALSADAFPSMPLAPSHEPDSGPLNPWTSNPVPMSLSAPLDERPPTPSEGFRARMLGAGMGLSAVLGAALVAGTLVGLTRWLDGSGAPQAVAAPPAPPTEAAPEAAPAPEPASVEPAPAPLRARKLGVSVIPAGLRAELRGASGAVVLPGKVTAGTYTAWADFGDGLEAAGRVVVGSGGPVTLSCTEAFRSCAVVPR